MLFIILRNFLIYCISNNCFIHFIFDVSSVSMGTTSQFLYILLY